MRQFWLHCGSTIAASPFRTRVFILWLMGMFSALAFAPFMWFFAAIPGFSLLLWWLPHCLNKKQAFWLGWWFGFGHFIAGLYWIANSLLVDPLRFAWLIPFAVSLIPAALAVYVGLVSLCTWLLVKRFSSVSLIGIFSAFWLVGEVARSIFFTGFPWNLSGYMLSGGDLAIQWAAIFGVYGLGVAALLLVSAPVWFVRLDESGWKYVGSRKKIIGLISLLLLIYGGGAVMLNQSRLLADNNKSSGLNIRLVQANIPQTLKWDSDREFENLFKHIDLTRVAEDDVQPDLVLWSESAFPFFLEREDELRKVIGNAIPKHAFLLTGAMQSSSDQIWNTVQALNHSGDIVGTYRKHKLVPFGEFVPLRGLLPFISKITPGSMDFSAGKGPETLILDKDGEDESIQIGPMVCYEAIFSTQIVDKNQRPQWLLNVTNDAWFGDSAGPHQHFEAARMRAVEEGLPLVRVANTGISGVIMADGTVLAKMGVNKTGATTIRMPLSQKTSPSWKIYHSYHDYVLVLLLLSLFIGAFFRRK